MKRMPRNGGFTMLEMLMSVLIMLAATGLIVSCVQIGNRKYKESTMISEAQLLAAELSIVIQDELTYATDLAEDNGEVTYTSYRYGKDSKIRVPSAGENAGRVVVVNGADEEYALANPGLYTMGDTGIDRVSAEVDISRGEGDRARVTVAIYGNVEGNRTKIAESDYQVRVLSGG